MCVMLVFFFTCLWVMLTTSPPGRFFFIFSHKRFLLRIIWDFFLAWIIFNNKIKHYCIDWLLRNKLPGVSGTTQFYHSVSFFQTKPVDFIVTLHFQNYVRKFIVAMIFFQNFVHWFNCSITFYKTKPVDFIVTLHFSKLCLLILL